MRCFGTVLSFETQAVMRRFSEKEEFSYRQWHPGLLHGSKSCGTLQWCKVNSQSCGLEAKDELISFWLSYEGHDKVRLSDFYFRPYNAWTPWRIYTRIDGQMVRLLRSCFKIKVMARSHICVRYCGGGYVNRHRHLNVSSLAWGYHSIVTSRTTGNCLYAFLSYTSSLAALSTATSVFLQSAKDLVMLSTSQEVTKASDCQSPSWEVRIGLRLCK